jgi:hypothetical protein
VEIELPIEHPAAHKNRIAFRPRRWRVFGQDGSSGGPAVMPAHSRPWQGDSLLASVSH